MQWAKSMRVRRSLTITCRQPAGCHWLRRCCLCQQLPAGLVQAHLRPLRVVGTGVDIEDILHAPDELGIGLRRDAPLFLQVGLEFVCFKTWRTVSYETVSTTSRATSLSASILSVQCFLPVGGSLQARAIKRASCSPSSLRWYSRSGALRLKAPFNPPLTYRCRTRATVESPTSSASAMAASDQPAPPS